MCLFFVAADDVVWDHKCIPGVKYNSKLILEISGDGEKREQTREHRETEMNS